MKRWRVHLYLPDGHTLIRMNLDQCFMGPVIDQWAVVEALNAESVVDLINDGANILKEPTWLTELRRDGHMHWTALLKISEIRR